VIRLFVVQTELRTHKYIPVTFIWYTIAEIISALVRQDIALLSHLLLLFLQKIHLLVKGCKEAEIAACADAMPCLNFFYSLTAFGIVPGLALLCFFSAGMVQKFHASLSCT
jgi:hypothetical protein